MNATLTHVSLTTARIQATMSETLTHVSLATLRDLHRAVDHGVIAVPLSPLMLRARGLDEATADRLARVLGPLPKPSLLAVLDTLIAERERAEERRPRLLWTGPEATGTTALDTRVQLLHLFENARKSAFIAGYLFDDPTLLRPLADATAARGLDVAFVLDVRATGEGTRDDRIRAQVAKFLRDIWPHRAPRPRIYVDPRTAAWNPDRLSRGASVAPAASGSAGRSGGDAGGVGQGS